MRVFTARENRWVSEILESEKPVHRFLLLRIDCAKIKIITRGSEPDSADLLKERYAIDPGECLLAVDTHELLVIWEKVAPLPEKRVVPFGRPYDYSVLY